MPQKKDPQTFLKKYRELLLATGGFILFISVLGGLSLFFSNTTEREKSSPTDQKKVFRIPADSIKNRTAETEDKLPPKTAFFLSPTPDELMQNITELSYHEFQKKTRDLPGLRIMWPAYFFSIASMKDSKAQIMLDTAENGFGVILTTEIDTHQYPEILSLERGEKIWLAAEIVAVDPEGTGNIQLTTEYIRFDDFEQQKPAEQEPENQ